jgi:hypothetical protein
MDSEAVLLVIHRTELRDTLPGVGHRLSTCVHEPVTVLLSSLFLTDRQGPAQLTASMERLKNNVLPHAHS